MDGASRVILGGVKLLFAIALCASCLVGQADKKYTIETVAGTLPNGNGIPATSALLSGRDLAVGPDGSIYVDDERGIIRKITADGIISDAFPNLGRMVVNNEGTIFSIIGPGLYIRKGETTTTISPSSGPIAGSIADVAADSKGNAYVAIPKYLYSTILRVQPDLSSTPYAGFGTKIALTGWPMLLAMDRLNNLYIGQNDNRVFRLSPDGLLTHIAGNGQFGTPKTSGAATETPFTVLGGLAVNNDGDLFIYDQYSNLVVKVTPQGLLEGTTSTAFLTSIATDASGRLLMFNGFKIFRMEADGSQSLVAGRNHFGGDGESARDALLWRPGAAALDPSGAIVIADTYNSRIRRVSAAGIIDSIAGTGMPGFAGDGGPAALAQVSGAFHMVRDSVGNIYFGSGVKVRRIGGDGTINTVAGTGDYGSSGDGGPAIAATFKSITGLALDREGKLYISDSTANVVRVLKLDGVIERFAGTLEVGLAEDGKLATETPLNRPTQLTVDPDGNLVIYEEQSSKLRKVIAATGVMETLARFAPMSGDTAAYQSCFLYGLTAMAYDLDGSLLFARSASLCRITPEGVTWLVAGTRSTKFAGDGGFADAANLGLPSSITVDGTGAIFLSDTLHHRVRKLTPVLP